MMTPCVSSISPKLQRDDGSGRRGREQATSRSVRSTAGKETVKARSIREVRQLKTMIRQGEARAACRYAGVKPENVHFLNMPFYETGTRSKKPLSG